jgi:hypothetical protein
MMSLPGKRPLQLSYWNAEARVVDPNRIHLEEVLKQLGQVNLSFVKSLDDLGKQPSDLVVIAAHGIPDESFGQWLLGTSQRMSRQGRIWLPALILTPISLDTLNEILAQAIKMNWYFDIINPDHLSSTPIRVANLLRIHDHLHEIKRYEETLDKLQNRVEFLDAELAKLKDPA